MNKNIKDEIIPTNPLVKLVLEAMYWTIIAGLGVAMVIIFAYVGLILLPFLLPVFALLLFGRWAWNRWKAHRAAKRREACAQTAHTTEEDHGVGQPEEQTA